MSAGPLRELIIVGGGSAGWMAAAVLARSFGSSLSIRLIESEAIGIVGVGEATIPQIRLLNQFLGIDEDEFLRATQGSIKLGIQFNGWDRPEGSYLHAFGDTGRGLGVLPFHQIWLAETAANDSDSLWQHSFNTQAALAGRYGRLSAEQAGVLGPLHHAYHFDAAGYAGFLRRLAEKLGVRRIEGRIVDVRLDPERGHLQSVQTEDGQRHAAEFFIDCSGFRALLIGQALKVGYRDWSRWLPCDRAVAVPSARGQRMRPYTQATARPAGWQWRIPLQHRVGNGHVYCSAQMSEDEATALLLANLEGEALAEPRPLRFLTGRRERFWQGNCVALGLASGFMEPLESTSIHLIQTGVSRLLQLFPDRALDPSLAEEYNRQTALEFEGIRDFLILHYHANGRVGEPFWDDRRALAVPERLAEKMALWRAQGLVSRDADELFTEGSWLQVLLGQCGRPARAHPLAQALPSARRREVLTTWQALIRQQLPRLPLHADFLAALR